MRIRLLLLIAALLATSPALAKSFTARDLAALKRLSGLAASPDGKSLVFTQSETDFAANRRRTDIWRLDLPSSQPIRLTSVPANDSDARWSPDGKRIYFLSARSGSSQLWSMARDGGDQRQVSDAAIDIAGFLLSPDGKRIAFWADVFPDCADLACTATRLNQPQEGSGRAYEKLFVRHWDSWKDGRRSQLFTAPLNADGKLGDAINVTRPLDGDVPSKPSGDASEISFSPDSRTLYFTLRDAGRGESWSTNMDIFAVSADGSTKPRNLTPDLEGADLAPIISPDGRTLVWQSQARAGFEADRHRIMAMDLASGRRREIAANWDRSVSFLAFAPDGRSLTGIAQHLGTTALWRISLKDGNVRQLAHGGTIAEVVQTGRSLWVLRHDLDSPAELYALKGRELKPLTRVNEPVFQEISFGAATPFSFAGWNGETVHGWVVAPPDIAPGKKVPVAFLVHGGPQASFGDQWHYRWNAQTYAGRGYAVVMIDFHGSTGYGQAFTDSISGDWGGKPLEDLRKGWAAALARFPFLDEDKACALGGSYGGYMMAWIASQWPDEFQCLVNHAGILDKRAMAYSTEELWFTEWENGGVPYAPGLAAQIGKDDPVNFVERWKTPTLVIHGEKDFRVPYTQGLGIFTALQRRGIESRLLIFPDENHWILKPANSIQWHDEVLGWLDRWLKPQKTAKPRIGQP
jgi:dipeptidyl aminopeptidase/acylaminoacyl peptidase